MKFISYNQMRTCFCGIHLNRKNVQERWQMFTTYDVKMSICLYVCTRPWTIDLQKRCLTFKKKTWSPIKPSLSYGFPMVFLWFSSLENQLFIPRISLHALSSRWLVCSPVLFICTICTSREASLSWPLKWPAFHHEYMIYSTIRWTWIHM